MPTEILFLLITVLSMMAMIFVATFLLFAVSLDGKTNRPTLGIALVAGMILQVAYLYLLWMFPYILPLACALSSIFIYRFLIRLRKKPLRFIVMSLLFAILPVFMSFVEYIVEKRLEDIAQMDRSHRRSCQKRHITLGDGSQQDDWDADPRLERDNKAQAENNPLEKERQTN